MFSLTANFIGFRFWGWGGTLVMFIARYLVGVRKRRKARPRWEKTEREGDVVDDDDDDDDDDDVVDDGSDVVGQERGKKQSKGKEGRRKKTEKTPNNSAHSLSPSLHPHNYLFSSTSSISSIPLDLP
jgi:hypothetical protein